NPMGPKIASGGGEVWDEDLVGLDTHLGDPFERELLAQALEHDTELKRHGSTFTPWRRSSATESAEAASLAAQPRTSASAAARMSASRSAGVSALSAFMFANTTFFGNQALIS